MVGPKFLVVAACLVNLAAGLCAGVAVDRACGDAFFPKKHGGRRHGPPGMRMEAELGDALKLDDSQREKVSAIFKARGPQFEQIMAEMRPRMEAVRRESENDIRAVLTPEQLPKFEDFLKEKEKREREMRERWKRDQEKRDTDRPPPPPPEKQGS